MMEMKPIGLIHSPFADLTGMPIQPAGAAGVSGTIEVFSEHEAGLKECEQSHAGEAPPARLTL